MSEARKFVHETTPVDDIRQVRDQLNRNFDGDVRRLAKHAREVTEKLRVQLGLKPADAENNDAPSSAPEH
jgi:hypothetical protein